MKKKMSVFAREDMASKAFMEKYPIFRKIGWIILGIIILFWIIVMFRVMIPR